MSQSQVATVRFALGCPRSQMDGALILNYLTANGWTLSDDIRKANLVLVFTCGVTQREEDISLRCVAATARKKSAEAPLVILGCLAGINPQRLAEYGCICIPPKDLDRLDEVIGPVVPIARIADPNQLQKFRPDKRFCDTFRERLSRKTNYGFSLAERLWFRLRHGQRLCSGSNKYCYADTFAIRVAHGCQGECTYCGIRNAAGPLISKPPEQIMAEFRRGLDQGHLLFSLIAGDVGAYGQDIGTDIAELMESIFSVEQNCKVLIMDFSPRWLIQYYDRLFPLLTKNADRIGYASFPVQSGSDHVLDRMKRGYSRADAERCLSRLQRAAPQLDTLTHVMIGFPGETQDDFLETVDLIRRTRFRKVSVYKYEDRPGTDSLLMPDKLSEKVKARRIRQFYRTFPGIGHYGDDQEAPDNPTATEPQAEPAAVSR